MVIKPNMTDFNNLCKIVKEENSKNSYWLGDQNVINMYFKDINVLDVTYNYMKVIDDNTQYFFDPYENMYKEKHLIYMHNRPVGNPKVIHYISQPKPFMVQLPYEDEYYYEYKKYLDIVRKKFTNIVLNHLSC